MNRTSFDKSKISFALRIETIAKEFGTEVSNFQTVRNINGCIFFTAAVEINKDNWFAKLNM